MLPDVILVRSYRIYCTLGVLILPSGLQLRTIERPWLNNRQNVSCYPEGIYLCKWLARSGSGKYKRVWHITGVEGRTGILIHAANLVTQLLGCTAGGLKVGKIGGKTAVLSSKAAMNKIRAELSGQDFNLIVKGGAREQF